MVRTFIFNAVNIVSGLSTVSQGNSSYISWKFGASVNLVEKNGPLR